VGDAAMHLLDIINDILDLSKIDAGKLALAPVDFSVDALLARATAMVTDSARRKGLALTVDRGDLPQVLRGDALRLSQILVNLLSNAVKFTARGSVVLRCDVLGQAGSEWTIRFAVRDTGVGISPEAQERLFSPFEQADGSTTRRFGGTGLGLSIARELAQLMGGAVGVESETGRGSVFWFTAKLHSAGTHEQSAPTPYEAVATHGVEQALKDGHRGARVLIADDNRINQELATELLRLVDLQVEVADNGRIAVDMARRGAYDMILMDMQMPEMDGLEATRQIRTVRELDATPIVAMTASAFGADRDACLAAGMNDHIGKPVNPVTLYEKMLRWLDESRKAPRAAPGREPPPSASPPPPAQPTDVLEDIEALDVVRGMSLFAGQRALYMQALGYFVDLYTDGLAAVDRYLAGAPGATREAAGRDIHSMGGAAAALGAIELENAAHRIDKMVRGDRAKQVDDAELRSELEALRTGLADLVARLGQALGRRGQAT
jgi:CheY-like chemotaxis protein/HPt (histidine-containing phosphotransfer) domain-containing protein/two-component sensor histidine kinase